MPQNELIGAFLQEGGSAEKFRTKYTKIVERQLQLAKAEIAYIRSMGDDSLAEVLKYAQSSRITAERWKEELKESKVVQKLTPQAFKDMIIKRTAQEPMTGTYDTMLYIPRRPSLEPQAETTQNTPREKDAKSSGSAQNVYHPLYRTFGQFPVGAFDSERKKETSDQAQQIKGGLYAMNIPTIFMEYKRWSVQPSDVAKASHQCRAYMVSSLVKLESLGITKWPVFGLIAQGPIAALTVAWMTAEHVSGLLEHRVDHLIEFLLP